MMMSSSNSAKPQSIYSTHFPIHRRSGPISPILGGSTPQERPNVNIKLRRGDTAVNLLLSVKCMARRIQKFILETNSPQTYQDIRGNSKNPQPWYQFRRSGIVDGMARPINAAENAVAMELATTAGRTMERAYELAKFPLQVVTKVILDKIGVFGYKISCVKITAFWPRSQI
ncbi:hypothetical protein CASFOL_038908 [Castilleja foliolosa]|uniref:Uncharacterized protein n=1 Tax=Castilleja foliolosa TaxID=1961234 RepID=A0ABD3BJ91_9LAMI